MLKSSLASVLFALASCNKTPLERNLIVFQDEVPVVEDSIRRMEQLLEKLPEAKNDEGQHYFIYEGKVEINDIKFGRLEDIKRNERLDTIRIFQSFSLKEIQAFMNLIPFLQRNFIYSSYKSSALQRFVFQYRQTESNEYHDLRQLIIINNPQDTLTNGFTSSSQILDRKGSLVLLAPNDIEIK